MKGNYSHSGNQPPKQQLTMFFFTQSGITQEAAMGPKIWSFPELLETPDPLSGEPDYNAEITIERL